MAEVSNELRPYQWALPESLDVPPDELQVRLDFYRDSVLMHLLDRGVITTRMVSARDVTLALLSSVPIESGVLPEGSLWWGQGPDGVVVALWRMPKVWKVALQTEPFKPPLRFRLPMPGLIFICQAGRPPRIFAAKKRPTSPEEYIYHAPLFNLFENGLACPGTHKFPADVGEIPESFFTSFFTREAVPGGRSKKHEDNLLALWEELDGKKRYPVGDLVRIGKLKEVLK